MKNVLETYLELKEMEFTNEDNSIVGGDYYLGKSDGIKQMIKEIRLLSNPSLKPHVSVFLARNKEYNLEADELNDIIEKISKHKLIHKIDLWGYIIWTKEEHVQTIFDSKDLYFLAITKAEEGFPQLFESVFTANSCYDL